MSFQLLLVSLLLGFALFGATLFSVSQAIAETGVLRWMHVVSAAAVLIAMAALYLISTEFRYGWLVILAQASGLAALAAAGGATIFETGWRRLNPAPIAVFGGLVASGAPFAA